MRIIATILVVLASASPAAAAESYPSQRITLIVPFPPGSATDGVARHLADSIRAETNVTVVVENKPGADGNLAALAVLKAEPDGYTAFVTTNSTQAANVSLFNSLPYDPKADFAPVGGIMTIPMMLTVRSDFPANSVAEFLALAKQREKPLSFGSGNTSSRGAAELFKFRERIEMQHVPYRGMPQALTDLLGGQIDCVFADPSSARGLVEDGKLRVLAVTGPKRLETMPQLPTIAETGLPGYEMTAWVGVFVRAKTPPEIVARLGDLVTAYVNSPEARKYLMTVGATPFPSTPQQLAAFQEADTKRWAEIVETAKIERSDALQRACASPPRRRTLGGFLVFRVLLFFPRSSSSRLPGSASSSDIARRLRFIASNASDVASSALRSIPSAICALNLSVSLRSFSRKPRACLVTKTRLTRRSTGSACRSTKPEDSRRSIRAPTPTLPTSSSLAS
jgi:tripartite-type tricarboxylate transporter receptor subunit TctC